MTTKGVLTSGEEIDYCHGVTVSEYRGLATVSHNGSDAGFRSAAIWLPEPAVGVVVSRANSRPALFGVESVRGCAPLRVLLPCFLAPFRFEEAHAIIVRGRCSATWRQETRRLEPTR